MKKKILIGFIMNGRAGGVDKYILNYVNMVKEYYDIDILTNKIDAKLEEDLKRKNIGLFEVSSLKKPIKQYLELRSIMKNNRYDASYFNISTALHIIAPFAAYKANIPVRALHSHSSGIDNTNILIRVILYCIHFIAKHCLYLFANRYVACSTKAGEWLFPKKIVNSNKFNVVYNAVDFQKFYFDIDKRIQMRKNLDLRDSIVLGTVANFNYSKNHEFLVDVFFEMTKIKNNVKLLLVGEGDRLEKIEKRVKKYGIKDNVIFYGASDNVPELYQAMDIFILTSRFEGLPMTGVEAQCTGLPCVLSENITREVQITKNVKFLSIKLNSRKWAESIINMSSLSHIPQILEKEYNNYQLDKQQENYMNILEIDKFRRVYNGKQERYQKKD